MTISPGSPRSIGTGLPGSHNRSSTEEATMKLQTQVKAGGMNLNHNQTLVRKRG